MNNLITVLLNDAKETLGHARILVKAVIGALNPQFKGTYVHMTRIIKVVTMLGAILAILLIVFPSASMLGGWLASKLLPLLLFA